MMDFLFFSKTVAATLVLVILIQLKIGDTTIENHAVQFFKGSYVAKPLNEVAHGGARLISELVDTVHARINSNFNPKETPEKKSSGFRFGWNP